MVRPRVGFAVEVAEAAFGNFDLRCPSIVAVGILERVLLPTFDEFVFLDIGDAVILRSEVDARTPDPDDVREERWLGPSSSGRSDSILSTGVSFTGDALSAASRFANSSSNWPIANSDPSSSGEDSGSDMAEQSYSSRTRRGCLLLLALQRPVQNVVFKVAIQLSTLRLEQDIGTVLRASKTD
eukprot:m.1265906 g.1265906  ORF g.1265906 m.1265906 type:complete len:183 (-) comp24738_c0_seq5:33-581(-)